MGIKTTTITEDFSDEYFVFSLDLMFEAEFPFVYKRQTALDGSFGFMESTNKGGVYASSEVYFNVKTPKDSISNTLKISIAISTKPPNNFGHIAIVKMVNGEPTIVAMQELTNQTSEKTHFQTFTASLEKESEYVLAISYNKQEPYANNGLDVMQVLNLSLSSTFEDKSSYPMITKLVANKTKISNKQNMNQSIITVQFDKDVVEYVARLNGSDYSTGVLVHQGGAVSANTDAQVIIDWNELTSEGVNKINIYGKGLDGSWTINQG